MTGSALMERKGGFLTPLQRRRALKSLELYVNGLPWTKIKPAGGYSWPEFARLMVRYPDLGKAYAEARRISAHSFEDKALELADTLAAPNAYTGTGVRAAEVAMNQYRWSATRRNPSEYAEANANKISMIVPIQINSSLNLAEPGATERKTEADPYQFAAEVVAAEPIPASPDADELLEVENHQTDPENAPLPAGEGLAGILGLPDEVKSAVPQRKSPGRPPKRHKDTAHTGISRTNMIKKARRNPVVARALGLDKEDEENGGSNSGR